MRFEKGGSVWIHDNTGVKSVQAISLRYQTGTKQGGFRGTVKRTQNTTKYPKGALVWCWMTRTRCFKTRPNHTRLHFMKTQALLLNAQGQPLGTRLFGPVSYLLRRGKRLKLLSLASSFI